MGAGCANLRAAAGRPFLLAKDGGSERWREGGYVEELRLALVSTPRSGNAWVSRVVAQAFELDLLRFHNYLEAGPIPDRCVLQIHWYREPIPAVLV